MYHGRLKVALAQLSSGSDWRANLRKIERMAAAASRRGVAALLFPENALYMGPPAELFRLARQIEQEALPGLKALARRRAISLLLGSYPETCGSSGKVWNTSCWIDRRGRVLAAYRKIHLFDVTTPGGERYAESEFVRPGRRLVTFRWSGVRIGMTVCYDLRFPEQYRALARRGADWFLVPAAFTRETGRAHWHTLLRARAIENLATVLAPAQAGTHPGGRRTFGHSLAVGPWGTIEADGGAGEKLLVVEIPPGRERKLRERFGFPRQGGTH